MYIPKHFAINDSEEIAAFIRENSFGQLISLHDGAIVASLIPFVFDSDAGTLIGHLAKVNPQWQQVQDQKVLVSLQGDHAYVSPSWYGSAGVPTWNYQVAQIEGIAESFTDPERLRRLVDRLTEQNESGYSTPWKPDYPANMLTAIVGIAIKIQSIQCKYKISQNRSAADREQVRQQLEAAGHERLADAMEKVRKS